MQDFYWPQNLPPQQHKQEGRGIILPHIKYHHWHHNSTQFQSSLLSQLSHVLQELCYKLIDTSLWSLTCIIVVVVVVFVGVLISRLSTFFRGWFPWVGGGRFCSCLFEILDSESARWSDLLQYFWSEKMPVGTRGPYTFLDVLLAILLPPLGVFLKYGCQVRETVQTLLPAYIAAA